jgi:hypothetical protein
LIYIQRGSILPDHLEVKRFDAERLSSSLDERHCLASPAAAAIFLEQEKLVNEGITTQPL